MDQYEQSDEIQQLPAKESPVLLPLVSSDASMDLSLIPEKAHHPILSFPPHTIGKQRQSFCSSWYPKYSWLQYQEARDSTAM